METPGLGGFAPPKDPRERCRFLRRSRAAVSSTVFMTRWEANGPDSMHEVALDVDPGRFFEHYFSVVTGHESVGEGKGET